ncbi:ABC transporter ATP-binding protein [uncultured Ramlibacter sp.]|uniref:ABC transporter ATP-binding protein n=1 Tax=uncultured Ramlibacter sp. TaxID=260755 RepID=UPI002632EC32|nr:ABC transporter ATP-binding protein [uncultured Ramlibacter sp.]
MSAVVTVARTGLAPATAWGEPRDERRGDAHHAGPASTSAAPLLELRKVNSFYGPVQAHFDVDLQVRSGQIVSLLGGNASGKSTTMKVVLGLLRPRSGDVLFDGQSTLGLPTPQVIRRGIGSVPEARRLFPAMTVRENLLMGAYARNDSREVARDLERMLELFPRVAERIGFQAGTLSGGEQQMVAMARALMGRPRLLCMDEPTMGLSPLYVDKVLELIAQINRQGISVFMVEQNASLALQIAQHGYVLQTGRVVLSGPARQLLDDARIRDAYLGGDGAASTAS